MAQEGKRMLYCFKGFSRTAARTLGTALTIAGRQGCTAADTGHLLVAMLQTGRGVAVEFLRRRTRGKQAERRG